MKHILLTAITLALASGLVACDQKPAPDAKSPAGNVDIAAVAMPASAKMARISVGMRYRLMSAPAGRTDRSAPPVGERPAWGLQSPAH